MNVAYRGPLADDVASFSAAWLPIAGVTFGLFGLLLVIARLCPRMNLPVGPGEE